jgi:hypothetical protein
VTTDFEREGCRDRCDASYLVFRAIVDGQTTAEGLGCIRPMLAMLLFFGQHGGPSRDDLRSSVDHAASRMDITENGKFIEVLVPTGDSERDAVAAAAPELAPGRYQLHWHARSVPDGDFSDGFIPFTVAR